jgi:hypothetical protein
MTVRSRHPCLDLGPPAPVATGEKPLDQPSVSGVMEQRCRARVDVDPQVGTHGDGRSPADLESHGRVARLQFTDDRPADADHPSDLGLRHAQPQPKLTQFLAGSNGVDAEQAGGFTLDDPA